MIASFENKPLTQPINTATKRGYSLEKLADDYCLSVPFLRKLIRQKALKSTKIGRRVIVLAQDWDAFLESQN